MSKSFAEQYGNLTVGEALELAEQEVRDNYNKRRNEILMKILTIKSDVKTHRVYKQWLEQIYEFVKESSV